MFVTTNVGVGTAESVIALPASAINYAPYGDSVYVVENMKGPKGDTYKGVRQQFVKLGPGKGDQVAILSGLKPGEEVVTSGVFKLRQGAAVSVKSWRLYVARLLAGSDQGVKFCLERVSMPELFRSTTKARLLSKGRHV